MITAMHYVIINLCFLLLIIQQQACALTWSPAVLKQDFRQSKLSKLHHRVQRYLFS